MPERSGHCSMKNRESRRQGDATQQGVPVCEPAFGREMLRPTFSYSGHRNELCGSICHGCSAGGRSSGMTTVSNVLIRKSIHMSLAVTFLGTGGAVPTTRRNTSAVLVRREGERLLFDCGEGTQRQMMRFGTGFGISHVFLSHLHGDHVLGLPGLCQTFDFNDREEPLAIHTPPGTKRAVENLVGVTGARPGYPVRVTEATPGSVVLRADEYEVRAFETDHRTRSVGYALVEDDRRGRFDRERA